MRKTKEEFYNEESFFDHIEVEDRYSYLLKEDALRIMEAYKDQELSLLTEKYETQKHNAYFLLNQSNDWEEKYNKLKEAFEGVLEENWEFMESADAAGIGSLNGLTKEKFINYEYKKAGL